MKAPMCPICGEAHWGLGQCPKFATESKAERAKKAVEAVTIKTLVTIKTDTEKHPGTGRGGRRPGAGRKPNGGSEAVRKRVAAHRARKRAAVPQTTGEQR
jgi:hypothetical protein